MDSIRITFSKEKYSKGYNPFNIKPKNPKKSESSNLKLNEYKNQLQSKYYYNFIL